jgi:transcription initiation factor IIF auxiliary subunit
MINFPLELTIINTAVYGPFDQARKMRWYDWELYIDCKNEEFYKETRTVVYHLHPSFPITEIHKKNREDKFKLSSRGWGEFKIGVEMILRDDTRAQVDYWLRLGEKVTYSKEITLNQKDFEKRKDPNKRIPSLRNIF